MRKLKTNPGRRTYIVEIAVSAVVALSSLPSAMADVIPLTLDEAIARATRAAPQVVAAAATLEAAQITAPSAGRLPDPEFVAGIENLPIETADRFSLTRDFMTMRKVGLMQTF